MKTYHRRLTATVNAKGVLDIDTVKGCALGMRAHPRNGCYGLCYACKIAVLYGIDFTKSVSRIPNNKDRRALEAMVANHWATWFRVGTAGDPCHDWNLTIDVCKWFSRFKTPIIVTKHWITLTDEQIGWLAACQSIVNTSVSALDLPDERSYRLSQYKRLSEVGVRSVLRVVTCRFGENALGKERDTIQSDLLSQPHVIDNPLRIPESDPRVASGEILIDERVDSIGGSKVSVFNPSVYLGNCQGCPDQCGATMFGDKRIFKDSK